MIPYSTPLWTIFTKWPAPASPKCRQPSGGASTSRIGASRSTASLVAADHHAVADLEPPDAAGGADVDVVDARARAAPPRGGRRRASWCCRRRRSCRPRRAGRRARRRSARSGRPPGPSPRPSAGRSSLATRSSSEDAPVAPWPSAALTASSLKSNATTLWSESRWMRWTMLPPIFPRPTKPSCIRGSPSRPARRRGRASAGSAGRRRPAPGSACANVYGSPGTSRSVSGLVDDLRRTRRPAGRPCGTGRSSAGSAGRSRTWSRRRAR